MKEPALKGPKVRTEQNKEFGLSVLHTGAAVHIRV